MELAKRAIENTELDKVLEIIKSYSLSLEGRESIKADKLTADYELIESRYQRIDSYIGLLEGAEPLSSFPSISELFLEIEKSHRDVDGLNIRSAGEYLDCYFRVMSFLKRDDEIDADIKDLSDSILRTLDSDGSVREDHPRIKVLIKERDAIRHKRLSFSESFISENRSAIQSANPLYKNERVVIAVKADKKLDSECYISGSSTSGATLFAEPFELVELNNKVVLADERIRAEKLKIIHELSERVRSKVEELKGISAFIADFDYHYSFARWAKKEKAKHPELSDKIHLIAARHPLLGSKAVPIDIHLDKNARVLVLSGANAGGKTVTMKTIALTHMLYELSGFALIDENSTVTLFSSFYSDIGDGQSIEREASTFSSHMTNIGEILKKADEHSLILLDELGSGTDPEEGSALSISILEYLSKKARLTLTTSHYQAVKNYAYSSPLMANASMAFNEKSGLPTYRVIEGVPGDSYALYSAKRAALPKEVIERAESLLGDERESSAKLVSSLLSKSRTLDRKITEAELLRREALRVKQNAAEKEKELEKKIFELEKTKCTDIDSYISAKRKEVEKLVHDIRTGKLTKEKIQNIHSAIDELDGKKDELKKSIEEKEKRFDDKDDRVFEVGENVLCSSSKTPGRILEKRGKSKYYVELSNGLKLEVKSNMLYKAKSEAKPDFSHFKASRKAQYEMDLRGYTLEEALRALDDQIEAAILSNLSSFSIIHGYGDGILSRGIHQYLKKRKEVKDYRFALPEDGGMGKTYVTLSF